MASQLGVYALRNDQTLARYVIEGRYTGKQLGVGSYGSVEEVEVNGLICAGKKIHEILLDVGNVGMRETAEKYIQECQLMSDLRHPHITQFLGLCFFPSCQFPILLMERLDGSLDDLLETVPDVPLVLKRSILEDIARGLLYLHKHNPQIIHRDLTAKNVLLTSSFSAKITDFGNSRIVNIQPGQLARTLSRVPGTLAYMPPEALSASARYGPSLDIFSFGNLALFTLNQVFPGSLLEHTFPDPDDPNKLTGRSEVERRAAYFQQLVQSLHRRHHSLIQLIKDCLHNTPAKRPTATQLCTTLGEMKGDIEGPYKEFSTLDAMRQVATMKALQKRESEVKKKTDELATKDEEIQQLSQRLDITQMQLQLRERELQQKDTELQQRNTDIVELQKQLESSKAVERLLQAKLNGLQVQTSGSQALLSGLDVPLSLRWRHGKAMPFAMSLYPQAIVLHGKVYVGSGKSSWRTQMRTVTVYDPQKDEWTLLPSYSNVYFGMASLKGQLLLIGGQHPDTVKTTNQLSVWDEKSRQWQSLFLPLMPTPRCSMAVAHNDWWIVVAGGRNDENKMLSKVEIFNVSVGKWFESAPLPRPAEKMTTAIVGNKVVLLGGADERGFQNEVFCLSLDSLASQATTVGNTLDQWHRLPSTPFKSFTALAYNGALLAIGGQGGTRASVIYIYRPREKCWVKGGDLPTDRVRCSCAVLPGGEIFVAGGAPSSSHSTADSLLVSDIAMVSDML